MKSSKYIRALCLPVFFIALAIVSPSSARTGDFGLGDLGFGLGSENAKFPDLGLSEKPLLTAKLVSESAYFKPGNPFTLLVNLNHQAGAYSYWHNPGGPGVGTSITWNLPEGFSVSEPSWPLPQRHENAGIVSYVYKGSVNLVFSVTPPESYEVGKPVTIAGEVHAQACTPKTCHPMRLPIRAQLTAASDAPPPIEEVAKAKRRLPGLPKDWSLHASEEAGEYVITLKPEAGANRDIQSIYFYDRSEPHWLIDAQLPQRLEKGPDAWRLHLPMRSEPGTSDRLSGILVADVPWLNQGGDDANPVALSVSLSLPTERRHAAGAAPADRNAPLLLLFAFLGGLLLNIMPCVFPVIGLKIMGFAKQAHKERRSVFLHGLSYASGVLICFWTLAFLVITMGRGWGAQLQSDWFMFALCHLFMIMSLNLAGVFEVGTSVAGAGQSLNRNEGLKRSFFTGLLATITSTPCSAPFLGTALAYALSLPAVLSLGVFTLMGLGFSFPYLALSLFPAWLKKLPKPGPWMDTFRQAMCFPLFATTAYMLWTMEGMIDEWRFLMLLFGLVLTATACWLYGKSQKSRAKSPRIGRAVFVMAVAAFAGGLWLGLPKTDTQLEWRDWSPELVSRLREEGRPVYVDFTARWCATCQVNKRVYQDEDLVKLLLDKNVALLKADWTLYDERITSTLKNEFDKAAVPVTVVYLPGQKHGRLLPEILTSANVVEAINGMPY